MAASSSEGFRRDIQVDGNKGVVVVTGAGGFTGRELYDQYLAREKGEPAIVREMAAAQ